MNKTERESGHWSLNGRKSEHSSFMASVTSCPKDFSDPHPYSVQFPRFDPTFLGTASAWRQRGGRGGERTQQKLLVALLLDKHGREGEKPRTQNRQMSPAPAALGSGLRP